MNKDIELDIAVENAKKALEKFKTLEELKRKPPALQLKNNNRISKNRFAF